MLFLYTPRGIQILPHPFLISALDIGDWFSSRCGCFFPSKEPRYPFSRRQSGPRNQSGWFWRVENLFQLLRFELRVMQPVASRYNLCTRLKMLRIRVPVTETFRVYVKASGYC